MTPFPPDRESDRDQGHNKESGDKGTSEPFVTLSPVENHFKTCKSYGYERDTDAVNPKLAAPPGLTSFLGEFDRIVNHSTRQKQRQQAYRYIDEEDPPPGEVVCNPTTERRSDRGRGHDGHTVEREGGAKLRFGKCIDQDGLLDWRQTATTKA